MIKADGDEDEDDIIMTITTVRARRAGLFLKPGLPLELRAVNRNLFEMPVRNFPDTRVRVCGETQNNDMYSEELVLGHTYTLPKKKRKQWGAGRRRSPYSYTSNGHAYILERRVPSEHFRQLYLMCSANIMPLESQLDVLKKYL